MKEPKKLIVYKITVTKKVFDKCSEETLNYEGKCDESMAKSIVNHVIPKIKNFHLN